MFEHRLFQIYDFAKVPLDAEIFLVDEKWMADWEQAMVRMFEGGEYANVGYISWAVARSLRTSSMEISWYPNIHTRFHEVKIVLPRSAFVTCVGCHEYDERPHLFVKSEWLDELHVRSHSVFALLDAIGVKKAILDGSLTRSALLRLRRRVDTIASKYPSVSFLSFADSLLLKSNWRVGRHNSKVKYSYEPEVFVRVFSDVRKTYSEVLGLPVYGIFTQGSNEFYGDELLHISASKNHVSLNSLGLPFAQLLAIDHAVSEALHTETHEPADLYMDEDFFHSLNFRSDFVRTKNDKPKAKYRPPMGTGDGWYFYSKFNDIRANLLPRRRNSSTPRK
jgi:hypothetical protein